MVHPSKVEATSKGKGKATSDQAKKRTRMEKGQGSGVPSLSTPVGESEGYSGAIRGSDVPDIHVDNWAASIFGSYNESHDASGNVKEVVIGSTTGASSHKGKASILEELAMLDECYPLNEHAQQLCLMGPVYEEPLDDEISIPEPMVPEEEKNDNKEEGEVEPEHDSKEGDSEFSPSNDETEDSDA
ncbi:hypothetical protein HAX54_036115 [Datura stramonium]|uniref:Uncharacterized protein n=1 Tax=Datura stramonium TaxID=4076 RepID=A0ABS8VGC4_DATST|nr:hypothetical protein [Datura stramonium]